MPKGKKAGTANDSQYEALRRKGLSKSSSAAITNASAKKKGSRRKG